jgi:steroid delta-isomerase-like uncharacterized protein
MVPESEAVMRRWFTEIWNEQRLDRVHELWAQNGVAHGITEGGADDVHGPDEWRTLVQNMLNEFEDFRIEVEDAVADGEKVAVRWILTGTYVGEVLVPGVEKGKRVRVVGMTMGRVREGKIVEGWNVWDILGMIRQLGGDVSMNKMLP